GGSSRALLVRVARPDRRLVVVPVQTTTRQARGCRTPTCRVTPGQTGRDELVDIGPTGSQALDVADHIWPPCLRPRAENDRDFARGRDPALGSGRRGKLTQRAAHDGLMQLGELAADRAGPV